MLIPEDPQKELLDDEGATRWISDELSTWTSLVRDLANYGSHLIPRAYSSSDKTLPDAIVLGVLLRQVVAMMDAMEILLSRSAVHAAALQLRAMFEASVYLRWTLAAGHKEKALYYYTHHLLDQRRWAMRVQAGTAESNAFRAPFDAAGLPLNDNLGELGRRQAEDIDRILSHPEIAPIRADFRRWKKENNREPAWYSPLGMATLRAIAASIGEEPMYVLVYKFASEVMHASKLGEHISFSGGKVKFRSIRHPGHFPDAVRFCMMIAFHVFRAVLGYYRPGELKHRFPVKYVEKWRQAFMGIPHVSVNETD